MGIIDSVKTELGDALDLYGQYESIRNGSNVGSTSVQEPVRSQTATTTKVEMPDEILGMPKTVVIVGGIALLMVGAFVAFRK